jgi:hypothetical protein
MVTEQSIPQTAAAVDRAISTPNFIEKSGFLRSWRHLRQQSQCETARTFPLCSGMTRLREDLGW